MAEDLEQGSWRFQKLSKWSWKYMRPYYRATSLLAQWGSPQQYFQGLFFSLKMALFLSYASFCSHMFFLQYLFAWNILGQLKVFSLGFWQIISLLFYVQTWQCNFSCHSRTRDIFPITNVNTFHWQFPIENLDSRNLILPFAYTFFLFGDSQTIVKCVQKKVKGLPSSITVRD